MRTPAEILADAADHVEHRGWFQISPPYRVGEDPQCALSAIWKCLDSVHQGVRCLTAERALQKEIGDLPIITWNDTPGRTREEVAATLRNAKRWL